MTEEGFPFAVKVVGLADPAVCAAKVFTPEVVPSVGVQLAIPLELVTDEVHAETDPPPLATVQVTAIPAPTELAFASLTTACKELASALPAVPDWLLLADTVIVGGPTVIESDVFVLPPEFVAVTV
jgi:hypothetical protein